jgi:hypothetical protein
MERFVHLVLAKGVLNGILRNQFTDRNYKEYTALPQTQVQYILSEYP